LLLIDQPMTAQILILFALTVLGITNWVIMHQMREEYEGVESEMDMTIAQLHESIDILKTYRN